jgi:hypothetical protein
LSAFVARLCRSATPPPVSAWVSWRELQTLLVVHRGVALFLELKRLGGRQSEEQLEFERRARLAGVDYEVRDTLDRATELLIERGIMRNAVGLLP